MSSSNTVLTKFQCPNVFWKCLDQTVIFNDIITNSVNKLEETAPGITHAFVYDNASFHNTDGIRKIIMPAGHTHRPLPPHSPSLNPIENMFCIWKVEAKKRKMESKADVLKAIDDGAAAITATVVNNSWQSIKKNVFGEVYLKSDL